MLDQNEVFRSGEGDSWFERNRGQLGTEVAHDRVSEMVRRLAERQPITSLCEIGCANGWRLALLRQQIGSLKRLAGADVSHKAIQAGRKQWRDLELQVGSAESPALDGTFDVVVLSFVLHWVDRGKLAASVAAADALLRDGGYLAIADFLPDQPCKRRYHHRQDVDLFTYKQDYRTSFTSLGFYEEVESEVFSHAGQAVADPQDRAVCALLKKSLATYALV